MFAKAQKLTRLSITLLLSAVVAAASASPARAQTSQQFEPKVGQPGKDAVWVPTPEALVETMLDLAKVTPQDYVIDLGSGDGRNVIAAAKRGAQALGVEYNPDLVEYSRRKAKEAGVEDKATFVQGDMYAADISKATVLPLFLLPQNLEKLRDKFMALEPGSRIVLNTFAIPEWEPDVRETAEGDCGSWCTALLYIVPARVAGTWKLADGGELTLTQEYQKISGTLSSGNGSTPTTEGRLRGEEITFVAGDSTYVGRVNGDRMEGTVKSASNTRQWSATRVK